MSKNSLWKEAFLKGNERLNLYFILCAISLGLTLIFLIFGNLEKGQSLFSIIISSVLLFFLYKSVNAYKKAQITNNFNDLKEGISQENIYLSILFWLILISIIFVIIVIIIGAVISIKDI